MLASSDLYKAALHGPHHRVAYIDSFDIDGNPLAARVPVLDGQVRADLTNRVTRSADFTLSDEWFPRTPQSAFSPYQAVVRIWAGTGFSDGSEEIFPLFTGRVSGVTRNSVGSVTFRADDLAADVIGFRFEAPTASMQTTVLAEIRRLILEALPQASFGTDTTPDAPTPQLAWDEDRGRALDDLASAVGGRWFSMGDGSFVVRPFTYSIGPVVQQFLDGPTGLMSSASTFITRDGTANSVVVVAERMDGTEPVRRIERDVSPTSPTLFGGKFGRVSQITKVQTPLTASEAQTLAKAQLSAASALTEQWTSNVVPDYTMEPGDTVRLSFRGYSSDQIIDTVSYPLITGSTMTLGTRSFGAASVSPIQE